MNNTILLVDDDPGILVMLKHALEECGYKVCTASNGDEALKLVQSDPTSIHGIITDFDMPILNGAQFIAELRKNKVMIPFVVHCSHNAEAFSAFSKYEPAAIISKPSIMGPIIFAVQKLLE